jgi:putative ATP-binding cassette transporter
MSLFSILCANSVRKVFFSLLLGATAGMVYALLIPLVTSSFGDSGGMLELRAAPQTFLGLEISNHRFAALYLGACLVIFAFRTTSQVLLTWVVIDATSSLRQSYFHRIVNSPLAKLEQAGFSRLITSITTDVQRIVNGVQLIPDLMISLVTLMGMLLFLLYLNTSVFKFVCGAVLFGAVTFQIPVLLGKEFFKRARQNVDTLYEAINGNIKGVKELKLCQSRRNSFFRDILLKAENDVRSSSKTGITIVRGAMNYGEMISFFVIGYVAYIFLNYHAVTTPELIAAVMVLLYITGPVGILMNTAPEILQANVSLRQVNKLFADLPQEDITPEIRTLPRWSKIRFSGLVYQYRDQEETPAVAAVAAVIAPVAKPDGAGFAVGPLDFELNRGEVTFIVGGNGSGKSTLAKLVTSHYLPKSGEIYLDSLRIDRHLINTYRDRISAIYTDYYLFERLLGSSSGKDQALIDEYIRLLKLEDKVTVSGEKFSTLALSDGQRKRLALLVSVLEDKDIYLFDEWAADQDPVFKNVFYTHILAHLKKRNKVVVVISHDDRYFHVADKILVMEQGQLVRCDVADASLKIMA